MSFEQSIRSEFEERTRASHRNLRRVEQIEDDGELLVHVKTSSESMERLIEELTAIVKVVGDSEDSVHISYLQDDRLARLTLDGGFEDMDDTERRVRISQSVRFA